MMPMLLLTFLVHFQRVLHDMGSSGHLGTGWGGLLLSISIVSVLDCITAFDLKGIWSMGSHCRIAFYSNLIKVAPSFCVQSPWLSIGEDITAHYPPLTRPLSPQYPSSLHLSPTPPPPHYPTLGPFSPPSQHNSVPPARPPAPHPISQFDTPPHACSQ